MRFGRAKDGLFGGRSDAGELTISVPLPWVSGEHAELGVDADGVMLDDLGSRNGTLVEGRVIDREVEVRPGDVFEIGRSFWIMRRTRQPISSAPELEPTGSANPGVRTMLRTLERLSGSNVPLMLVGETGVGKEYIARAIHEKRGRQRPFLRLNVMAGRIDRLLTPEGEGMLRDARGGTLFLDDVGELPLPAQAKLVSVLMAHIPARAQPIDAGSDEIRVIAATTRDVRSMVATDAFRPDLYGRLSGFEARLPPLRDRREDLGLLLRQFARAREGKMVRIAPEVFREMLDHDWPFNVRELEQTVAAAVVCADEETGISGECWAEVVWGRDDVPSPARIQAVRHALVQELAAHGGNTLAVAASLKCDMDDLRRWLTRFELQPEQYSTH